MKLALLALGLLILVLIIARVAQPLFKQKGLTLSIDFSKKWSFNFHPVGGEGVKNSSELEKIVQSELEGKVGEFAILIDSLDGKEAQRHSLNEDNIFPSASLYKLFLLSAAFRAIEEGRLKEDQTITASLPHLEETLGSVDFGYEEIEGDKISYKVSEILDRITRISDNYASIMLADKLGWDSLEEEARRVGARNTSFKSPISTTASDIALYLRSLYAGEIVSQNSSQKIIDLLSKAQINNRIPAQLPKEVKVAHKTGELSRVRHDAGIVFLEGKPYLIVLMSKDLKFENDGVEILANISGDVYEYFAKLANKGD